MLRGGTAACPRAPSHPQACSWMPSPTAGPAPPCPGLSSRRLGAGWLPQARPAHQRASAFNTNSKKMPTWQGQGAEF